MACGSMAAAREKGLLEVKGKATSQDGMLCCFGSMFKRHDNRIDIDALRGVSIPAYGSISFRI